ncbi:hypothetical protein LTR66_005874 [Elasticomyces elasticus]|nr:hypothetical protein LTR66_005874 [Elasticomyces elasticus]KAK5011209.1 hypothetical protein LTR28_004874 [Elasticomyces elasticus]
MTESNRQRQASELVLLQSMYPTEFTWRSSPPTDPYSPELDSDTGDAAFSISFDSSYTLEISLPRDYPSHARPKVYLACGGEVETLHRKEARSAVQDLVESLDVGVEALDLLVTGFAELLPELLRERGRAVDTYAAGMHEPKSQKNSAEPKIKRVVIWSHHLLSTSKRRDILAWSRELHLRGFSRPGHPGAVFAEGEEDAVDEFVRRLKELRWQALQVRDEVVVEARVLGSGDGRGVEEVEGIGDVVEGLKGRDGCAEMFLKAMRIARAD